MLTNGGRFMDGAAHHAVDIVVVRLGKSMGNGDCERKLFYAQINCILSKQVNQAEMLLTHVLTKCSAENQYAISIGIFIHTNILPTSKVRTECRTRTRTI